MQNPRTFSCSVCDPLVRRPIDRGLVASDAVLSVIKSFPWGEMIAKTRGLTDDQIHFSPSIQFVCVQDQHTMEVTVVSDPASTVFYVYYIPKPRTREEFEVLDQTVDQMIDLVELFRDARYPQLKELMRSRDREVEATKAPWWKIWAR